MKFVCLLTVFLVGSVFAAEPKETKVKTKDLPPAVQQGVERESKGATLKGVAREVENGKTLYEVETVVNGRTRDTTLDESGNVVLTEEEIPLSSIPAAAKAAIEKEAAGWKIKSVEILKKDGATTYEAHLGRMFKSREVVVDADGKVQK